MSYRDDDAARGARADALIGEISELERQRVARAEQDRRLEAARRELATLQPSAAPLAEPRPASVAAHVLVFVAAAGSTFAGYSLLF